MIIVVSPRGLLTGLVLTKKPAQRAGLFLRCIVRLPQAFTSGPREAGPFDPPPPGPLGFGLRGTVRLRAPGNFSGFGVTGPSTKSKPILSWDVVSSLTSTTRT